MTESADPSPILVAVDLPEPQPLPPALVDLLASLRVVLVGRYAVPDQTLPAQARDQFEEEAKTALETVARPFEEAGGALDTILVFAHDRLDTLSRIGREQDCDAVLIPGHIKHLRRLLVSLRGLPNARHIAPFVADLVQDRTTEVTLLHVLEEDETDTQARETILEPAAEMMRERGIGTGLLTLQTLDDDASAATILEASDDYDAVVIGETKPSVREILFGTVPEKIAETAEIPVIVVRNPGEDVDVAVQSSEAAS